MKRFFQSLKEKFLARLLGNKRRYHILKGLTNRNTFEVHVTDHCNLNCKSCDHFSPVSEPRFVDLEKLEGDYKLLRPLYRRFFYRIFLLGGEPLLHPDIEEILVLTRKYFPKLEICLYTNGIKLYTMPESFWQSCRENSIQIIISNYPIQIQKEKVCALMDKWNIVYHFTSDISSFGHLPLDPLGKQSSKVNYEKCDMGGRCLQLKDGKLFPCARIAYIHQINRAFGMNFNHDPEDYLDVRKLNRMRFCKFIAAPKPFCRYCNLKAMHNISWGYSEKSKEEWF